MTASLARLPLLLILVLKKRVLARLEERNP